MCACVCARVLGCTHTRTRKTEKHIPIYVFMYTSLLPWVKQPRSGSRFVCFCIWRAQTMIRVYFFALAGRTETETKEDMRKVLVRFFGGKYKLETKGRYWEKYCYCSCFWRAQTKTKIRFTCLFSFWWEEQRLRLRKIWFEESIWYYSRFWREMFRPRARSRSLLFFSLWREELTENKEDTGFVWDSVCYSCFLVGNTKIKTEIWYFAFWWEEFIPRSRLRFVLCSGGAIWRNAVKIVVVFSSFVYCKNQDRPKS